MGLKLHRKFLKKPNTQSRRRAFFKAFLNSSFFIEGYYPSLIQRHKFFEHEFDIYYDICFHAQLNIHLELKAFERMVMKLHNSLCFNERRGEDMTKLFAVLQRNLLNLIFSRIEGKPIRSVMRNRLSGI